LDRGRGADNFRISSTAREPRGTARKSPPRRAAGSQLISEEQLDAALKRQRASGHKLGRTLVDAGFVSEEQICGALARQMRIPYINLKQFAFNGALVQTLPEAQARRFRAIVLDQNAGALRIGLADPTDLVAYDELTRLLKREINLAVVSESQLMASIDRLYRRTGEISALLLELTAELAQTDADFGALRATTP
jgi:MSHA biogenesis protein MshE